jgi:hypothetical protein
LIAGGKWRQQTKERQQGSNSELKPMRNRENGLNMEDRALLTCANRERTSQLGVHAQGSGTLASGTQRHPMSGTGTEKEDTILTHQPSIETHHFGLGAITYIITYHCI